MSLGQPYLEGLKDLSEAFENADVGWSLSGGVALKLMGLRRTTNDVDCLVDKPRSSLLRILQNRERWTFTHNVKDDYMSFFFDNQVLFEFFPTNMDRFAPNLRQRGLSLDKVSFAVPSLPAYALFLGKLAAAAYRTDKAHDASDLLWLLQAAGPEIAAARTLYQPQFVSGAARRFPELEAQFARLGIPVDTNVQVPDCSLQAQALRQMTTGWIQAALGTSVVYSRTAGGPRSAGQAHPYALLFRQMRLMMNSGSKVAARHVERVVGSDETFQIALLASFLLFDLALCIQTTPQGRELYRRLSEQYAATRPGYWELAQGYRHWSTLPSSRAR